MSKTSARGVEARVREQRALELRRAGWSYDRIGGDLGVGRASAFKIVRRVLQRLAAEATEDAGEVRRLELERLDALLTGLWPAAEAGDVAAVAAVLRAMERRARLLGLDAPTRTHLAGDAGGAPIEVSVASTIDPTKLSDAELETLVGLLDRAQRPGAAADGQ